MFSESAIQANTFSFRCVPYCKPEFAEIHYTGTQVLHRALEHGNVPRSSNEVVVFSVKIAFHQGIMQVVIAQNSYKMKMA